MGRELELGADASVRASGERENALGLAKGTGHHIALDRTPRSAVLAGGGAGCDLAEDAEPRDVQRHEPWGSEARGIAPPNWMSSAFLSKRVASRGGHLLALDAAARSRALLCRVE